MAVPPAEEDRFIALCTASGFAHARIGVVDDEAGALDVQGQFTLPLDELRTAHTSTLPAIFAWRLLSDRGVWVPGSSCREAGLTGS